MFRKHDISQQENVRGYNLQSLTDAPLRIPRRVVWKGVTLEHHLQPPGECEMYQPQPIVRISLLQNLLERRNDSGHWQPQHVSYGEVAIYPANFRKLVRWQQPAEFLLLFLDPELVTQFMTTNQDLEIFKQDDGNDPLLLQIGLTLKTLSEEQDSTISPFYIESLANTASAHLLHRYSQQKPATPLHSEEHFPHALGQIIDYIHANLETSLTINSLAAQASISPFHFAHLFKQTVGISPYQYIINARIERAKLLLSQGNLSLTEVAMRLGFADQSHFTRSFKRNVGVTPSAFLQR